MALPTNLSTGDLIDETWMDSVVTELTALPTRYVAVPTAWTAPTLAGTWVNFGGVYQVAQYRKVGDVVQLRGVVKTGTVPSTIFTLPAGFRPPASLQFATVSGGAFGYITVDSAGLVAASVGITTSFDLSVVRFSVVT